MMKNMFKTGLEKTPSQCKKNASKCFHNFQKSMQKRYQKQTQTKNIEKRLIKTWCLHGNGKRVKVKPSRAHAQSTSWKSLPRERGKEYGKIDLSRAFE